MFGSISRSWQIVKESLSVIKEDKEILLFPIISGVLTIILLVSFIVPVFLILASEGIPDIAAIALLFLFYFLSSFIIIFFNAGLVTCAYIRLNGGDPTFRDGLSNATSHIGKILVWALISATIGIILRVVAGNKNNVVEIGRASCRERV